MKAAGRRRGLTAVLVVCATGCGASGDDWSTITASTDPTLSAGLLGLDVDVMIETGQPGVPLDHRLLGTNLPAWLGPERLTDPNFIRATEESGVTLLRMPGGSWSNAYDWRACELAEAAGCYFIGSARPTDFIDFMQATELPGSWTVSINDSAQSAAAAVAFFNGDVDDGRTIGVDRHGVDWATVGSWAQLRSDGGNDAPVNIDLWEVGNEVYGGRPEAGGMGCADFGWEDVWTCDGTEYVLGDGDHDGYLAIREAMSTVDSTISVGAVGFGDAYAWGNWGAEVIESAGDALDFYVVHEYGFDDAPSPESAVQRPGELWPGLVAEVRSQLDADVPIAITEHNLVSVESGDAERTMTQAMNALYLADTIGQLATARVGVANQWNLANGTTGSGTDYGLISADDGSRFPAFHAMALWSRAGVELLPARLDDEALRVYPTRHADGRLTVVMLNLSAQARSQRVGLSDVDVDRGATLSSAFAQGLTDTVLTNRSADLMMSDGALTVELPGWSINVLELGSE